MDFHRYLRLVFLSSHEPPTTRTLLDSLTDNSLARFWNSLTRQTLSTRPRSKADPQRRLVPVASIAHVTAPSGCGSAPGKLRRTIRSNISLPCSRLPARILRATSSRNSSGRGYLLPLTAWKIAVRSRSPYHASKESDSLCRRQRTRAFRTQVHAGNQRLSRAGGLQRPGSDRGFSTAPQIDLVLADTTHAPDEWRCSLPSG